MDPLLQRLQIAQDLVQTLVGFLEAPIRPPRSAVQTALDAAGARVKALQAIEAQPMSPLVAPQLMPPTTTAAAAT